MFLNDLMATAVTLIFCFPVSFGFVLFFWLCSPEHLVLVLQDILYRAANNPVLLFSETCSHLEEGGRTFLFQTLN